LKNKRSTYKWQTHPVWYIETWKRFNYMPTYDFRDKEDKGSKKKQIGNLYAFFPLNSSEKFPPEVFSRFVLSLRFRNGRQVFPPDYYKWLLSRKGHHKVESFWIGIWEKTHKIKIELKMKIKMIKCTFLSACHISESET
jgi:hypothetical protein